LGRETRRLENRPIIYKRKKEGRGIGGIRGSVKRPWKLELENQ